MGDIVGVTTSCTIALRLVVRPAFGLRQLLFELGMTP
jgi:hypothetical protein